MAVNATAIWRVRPSGSNTNGGGYDPGIAGAGTDYSQQNAAQATGVNGTASGTATFTDTTAANFTSAMVGNALWIASGAGFTVGAYFIVTFNSTTSVVLDRSPGTGTVAHWALGGGWADPATNLASGASPVIGGNIVYVLGSGTPNPSSYTIDYPSVSGVNLTVGTSSAMITMANDPSTPGYKAPPDTTGGMPVIQSGILTGSGSSYWVFEGLYFVASGGGQSFLSGSPFTAVGCVLDTLSHDEGFMSGSYNNCIGCEVFSSNGSATGTIYAFIMLTGSSMIGCNIHDTSGLAVQINGGSATVAFNIIAKCGGDGINIVSVSDDFRIFNNTIDGNGGNGVSVDAAAFWITRSILFNNIISNHTTAAKAGLKIGSGSAATNFPGFFDYNAYYNNTANYSAISAGAHDTALGVTPYVNSTTENYTLA